MTKELRLKLLEECGRRYKKSMSIFSFFTPEKWSRLCWASDLIETDVQIRCPIHDTVVYK